MMINDAYLHWAEDDDWSGELEVNLLHGLVGQHVPIPTLVPASWKNNINKNI